MPSKPRLLEQVLDAYREGDLHECIHLVRTLVEAAPQATAPRQLLAALFVSTGNGRQALAHYRRLLPQAVARGEVIRTIAFQKQIDVLDQHDSLEPGRWLALQKQLRERGLPFVPEAPGAGERPWDEGQLLALPRAWFERIAAETRFEILGLEPRWFDVEAGTVWEVLAGRMRWSFALPDGRASAEALAAEGDTVHVDPGLARTARVSLVPELPVEVLRFEAALARDLRLALQAGLHVPASAVAGLSQETRAPLPTRPRRHEDLDEPVRVPAGSGVEPLKLPPPTEATPPATPPARDGGDWVDFGVLSLPDPAASGAGADRAPTAVPGDGQTPPAVPTLPERERVIDLPPVEAGAEGSRSAAAEPPAGAPEPEPVDADVLDTQDELAASDAADRRSSPSGADAAGAADERETQIERRRHPRVTVSLESRMALLRLSGSRVNPIQGQLGDLSTSGFSIRFTNDEIGASHAALADAVVAVDLDLPGPRGGLRLAAQVRWVEVDATPGETRLGIEFVLLTEPDRRRIAGTLAKAALAAHAASRKAA